MIINIIYFSFIHACSSLDSRLDYFPFPNHIFRVRRIKLEHAIDAKDNLFILTEYLCSVLDSVSHRFRGWVRQ